MHGTQYSKNGCCMLEYSDMSRLSEATKNGITNLATPMLSFGATFMLGAAMLTLLMDPGRFVVHTGASALRLRDLMTQEHALLTQRAELLAAREKLSDAVPTPTLERVTALKRDTKGLALTRALDALDAVRRAFIIDGADLVVFTDVKAADASLTIKGFVRDGDGRSMQILASFIDQLRSHDAFAHISEPEYQRVTGNDGTITSPFDITILLP